MTTSFENKKELRFIITLGTGKFGSSSNNQIRLEGFRATVEIDKAGGMMMGTLRAQIYGVQQTDMNSITTLQWKFKFRRFGIRGEKALARAARDERREEGPALTFSPLIREGQARLG